MPRRRSSPQELAAVLRRLERLHPGGAAPGWVPPGQPGVPCDDGEAANEGEMPERVALQERIAPRPPGLVARVSQAWQARAFDPGRRGVAVLAALALLGAAGGAWYFVAARPVARSTAAGTAVATGPASASAAGSVVGGASPEPLAAALSGWPSLPASPTTSAAMPIVVDVVGKVASPGVVELPAGARIRDAVDAAGGALPGTDLTALDLASRLSDGQEIFVGIPPPSGTAAQAGGGVVGGDSAGASDGGGGVSASTMVDVNTATLAELETLPGVGPVLAQHILDWRSQHGRFTAVSQLQQVSGIGPSKYAALAAKVRI